MSEFEFSNRNNFLSIIYKKNYRLQTITYVKSIKKIYSKKEKKKLDLWKSLSLLSSLSDMELDKSYILAKRLQNIVNPKNPKTYIENIYVSDLFTQEEWSCLSTKNKIAYGNKIGDLYRDLNIKTWDWLPIVGLICNLGKVLLLDNFDEKELLDWSILCDVYPLGCRISEQNRYFNQESVSNNKSKSLYGKYKQFCGFENLIMSYSHTEYLFDQLHKYKNKLPKEAMYIIRFFTFSAWHSPKEPIHRGYPYLANSYDWKMLPLLKLFNKYFNAVCNDVRSDRGVNQKLNIDIKMVKKDFLKLKRKYLNGWLF